MKFLYIIKGSPESLPPVLSQIKNLIELGHEITLVTNSISHDFAKYLNYNKISFSAMRLNSKFKLFNWIEFRYYAKKIGKKSNFDMVIFGSLDTAMACSNLHRYNKTILNLFELYDKNLLYKIYMKLFLKKYPNIICPEYNRSKLLKLFYHLKSSPLVIPNKPEFLGKINFLFYFEQELINKIESIKNKKIILYQGQIYPDRQLEKIASALVKINSEEYYFVLMGTDYGNFINQISLIYKNTVYLGYIPAPSHLEVTKIAHIGIVNYAENSLNNIYCAPNKIYEYGAFSKPMIGNDIPGLIYTIQHHNCGICINYDDTDSFIKAVFEIEENYSFYSNNAKKMFDSIDNKKSLSNFLGNIHL
jgi:glycosyltransferase involved in cell wall biosynthesis